MVQILVVIPAYNEEQTIGKVIDDLRRELLGKYSSELVVIDDGSIDQTAEISRRKGVKIIKHIINLGLGAALETGFLYATETKPDLVVTFDGDGQHSPADIHKVITPLLNGTADVVIGSRILSKTQMPLIRKVINYLSNFVTAILFGIWTTDSQSGLRGFTITALKQIKLRSLKMEVSSEIFKEIGRLKLNLIEVPIRSIYTNYSLTKGQKISNAPNVLVRLLLQRFS